MTEPAENLVRSLPASPAGRQLAWWLGMIADEGAHASPAASQRGLYTDAAYF